MKTDYTKKREEMVEEQLKSRNVRDENILNAFLKVPREEFVSDDQKHLAYEDYPLSIGLGQTISQPYIVAVMSEALAIKPGEKVLEIGTGSGYQTVILKELGAEVYTVERIEALFNRAKLLFDKLRYKVNMKLEDGSEGWSEYAPFDKIIVTAASLDIPQPLIKQLKDGGKMVIPKGGFLSQSLTLVNKDEQGNISEQHICGCIFVPLVGKYGFKK